MWQLPADNSASSAAMVVLKGIPKVLSPELLFALARMGHGDEIGELVDADLWQACDPQWSP